MTKWNWWNFLAYVWLSSVASLSFILMTSASSLKPFTFAKTSSSHGKGCALDASSDQGSKFNHACRDA